jgi:hypothetical protein
VTYVEGCIRIARCAVSRGSIALWLSLVLGVLVGCGKVTSTDAGAGGTGMGGRDGAAGGAGGTAGSGGQGGAAGADGGVRCGATTCAAGDYCSNCNVCCPVGALCICPDAGALTGAR